MERRVTGQKRRARSPAGWELTAESCTPDPPAVQPRAAAQAHQQCQQQADCWVPRSLPVVPPLPAVPVPVPIPVPVPVPADQPYSPLAPRLQGLAVNQCYPPLHPSTLLAGPTSAAAPVTGLPSSFPPAAIPIPAMAWHPPYTVPPLPASLPPQMPTVVTLAMSPPPAVCTVPPLPTRVSAGREAWQHQHPHQNQPYTPGCLLASPSLGALPFSNGTPTTGSAGCSPACSPANGSSRALEVPVANTVQSCDARAQEAHQPTVIKLPAGSRLVVGDTIIEACDSPHYSGGSAVPIIGGAFLPRSSPQESFMAPGAAQAFPPTSPLTAIGTAAASCQPAVPQQQQQLAAAGLAPGIPVVPPDPLPMQGTLLAPSDATAKPIPALAFPEGPPTFSACPPANLAHSYPTGTLGQQQQQQQQHSNGHHHPTDHHKKQQQQQQPTPQKIERAVSHQSPQMPNTGPEPILEPATLAAAALEHGAANGLDFAKPNQLEARGIGQPQQQPQAQQQQQEVPGGAFAAAAAAQTQSSMNPTPGNVDTLMAELLANPSVMRNLSIPAPQQDPGRPAGSGPQAAAVPGSPAVPQGAGDDSLAPGRYATLGQGLSLGQELERLLASEPGK